MKNYREKYFKYRYKYLNLIQQLGGKAESICDICLREIETDRAARRARRPFDCNHIFHQECVEPYLNAGCPLPH